MDFKERVEEKRKELVDTLLKYIETNPERWERGWYSVSNEPAFNPISQKRYKGLNAFYLYALSEINGYKDPRWLTFKQAKDLGANVKQGEHAANIFYWNLYDKSTKQSFSEETVKDLSAEERDKYFDDNVRPVLKYYQVFNADQCDNMPEYKRTAEEQSMAEEERAHQNALIERVISNSSAPISYGGNQAYYSPSTDSIRLPEIKHFKTMQDYYATALHEIAHSTGHQSRLNRDLQTTFGTQKYAKEELRAELASIFMQIDMGVSIEGNHFENHASYLASWLKAVKKDVKEFYSASAEAEKISEYVAKNYAQEKVVEQEIQKEEHKEKIENKGAEKQSFDNKAEQVHHRPLLINFYSGPGAGKTTVSLELTAELKKAGFNVEYVSEYAKELVLENKAEMLKDQQHVIDEQYRRLDRYRDSVDIIVTDSPLLLGQVYGEGRISKEYHNQIRAYHDSFDNFNLWVTRGDEAYQQAGRVENLEQAKELDGRIKAMMKANKLYYGNYNRGEIAKTVNRIKQTYNRLYGNQKEENTKENEQLNKSALDKNIQDWYKEQYPNDLSGETIPSKVTFNTLKHALEESKYWDAINTVVGSNNDIVRKRILSHFAEIQGKKEMEIYEAWLNQTERAINIPYVEQDKERARDMAHFAGLPFSDKYYDEEENSDLDIYDGSMSVEDYNLRKELTEQAQQVEQVSPILQERQERLKKAIAEGNVVRTYTIKSQVEDLPDVETMSIEDKTARESAEWLIKNNLDEEKDVKKVFYDYSLEVLGFIKYDSIEDRIKARQEIEKAITQVANEYKDKLLAQDDNADNKPLMIKSQVKGWNDWSTAEIKNQRARESAEWLINNGLDGEKDVKNAFHDYQTHDMADYIEDARKSAEKAIIRVADKYMQHLEGQDKENTKENEIKKVEQVEQVQQVGQYGKFKEGEIYYNVSWYDIVRNTGEFHDRERKYNAVYLQIVNNRVERNIHPLDATTLEEAYEKIKQNNEKIEQENNGKLPIEIDNDGYNDFSDLETKLQFKKKIDPIKEENTKENEIEKDKQAEQVQQVEQVKPAEWREINLKKENIVKEYEKSIMIRVSDGEYSSFVFSAPKKLVKTNDKKGLIKLSVKEDWQYELKNNGLLVELNGSDLCAVFAGKEVGKSAKRIAPTYQNSRRLENIRENVPEEMKNMPNWCAYKTRWNEAKGKRDKQIYTPLWRNIELKEEQLTGKSGQNTLIKVLDGEYANFEFLAPTELIKKDEKSDLYKLAVKLEGQYQLKNNETLAKFSGKELCDVLGKSKLRWGSIDDPETWATFDKAMEFAIKNNCDGLSFAIDGNGISCIDLDKCIVLKGKLNDQDTTLEEGAMNDTAKKLISELNGYCETSVSGNGLHFFLKDDILNNNKYKNRVVLENGDEIEVYDDKRFMSITGNIRSNTNELTRCPSATTSWLRDKLGARVTEQAKPKPSNTNRNQNIDMSDDAVIERIRRSKKGREFEELYRGGSVIGNRSQDDLKLLNILAFFTNGDEHQVERIFKQSGLYRPEKEKYLQHSIKTACATRYGSYGDNIKPRANQQSNGRR